MAQFWWNSYEHKRKIHWKSWDKLCLPKDNGGLGFRDVECFNQALLGKQAWRISHFKDSLLATLLKSRYFKGSDFHSAKICSRPSFGWRSIMYGRDLLVQGMDRRVGNGKSIFVWMDSWLPYHPPRPPWRKNTFIDLNLKVEELVDKENRGWNEGILEELFFENDARMIKQRPPIPEEDDYWIWRYTKTGEYSVKSGYNLALESQKSVLIRESKARPSTSDLHIKIWKLKTAPKIRHFLWRAIVGCLPVQDRLLTRGIRVETSCQMCLHELETTNHIIFSCSMARQIWAMSNIPNPKGGFDNQSFGSNLHYVFLQMDNQGIPQLNRRSIPWIIWRLWKNRNSRIFKGAIFCASDSLQMIFEDTSQWFEAQQINQEPQHESSLQNLSSIGRWSPPPNSWLKCNFACVWDKKVGIGGAAWILRDHKGTVLLHSRKCFTNMKTLLDLQCYTIRWAIESMVEHRMDKVFFSTNQSDIVKAILRPKAWPSFHDIGSAILISLRKMLLWRLETSYKTANKPAFVIAQSVIKDNRRSSYVAKGPPSWLMNLIQEECVQA